MNIISLIQSMADYICGKGATKEEIANCEKNLNTVFATDYKQYLEKFGLVCFDGRELTGICNSNRLHVVNVTFEERNKYSSDFQDWYVVEQTNIDGIVIWQDKDGIVYQVNANGSIDNTYPSLTEYIEKTKV